MHAHPAPCAGGHAVKPAIASLIACSARWRRRCPSGLLADGAGGSTLELRRLEWRPRFVFSE